jgi:hypothetical protein
MGLLWPADSPMSVTDAVRAIGGDLDYNAMHTVLTRS